MLNNVCESSCVVKFRLSFVDSFSVLVLFQRFPVTKVSVLLSNVFRTNYDNSSLRLALISFTDPLLTRLLEETTTIPAVSQKPRKPALASTVTTEIPLLCQVRILVLTTLTVVMGTMATNYLYLDLARLCLDLDRVLLL